MARKGIRRSQASKRGQTLKGFKDDIVDDLYETIDVQFNELVREVITDLTFGEGGSKGKPADDDSQWSTTLTGFFSSSWKASLSPVQGTEDRKGVWAKMETIAVGKGKSRQWVLAPGQKSIHKIRHYIPKDFAFPLDRSVYIGNTVNPDYLANALNSTKKSNRFIEYAAGGDWMI